MSLATEDETFRVLKKIPYAQLNKIFEGVSYETFKEITENVETRRQFLKAYGWTLEEFEKEIRKKYVKTGKSV